MPNRVLIADKMAPAAAEVFTARGIEADVKVGLTPEDLKATISEYDGLAVRSATKVTAEIIAASGNLKVIGRAGIGIDNIDLDVATERGVVVMNTPFGNSVTTAEHAIAMMTALARQIPLADRSTRAGKWEKSRFMGIELRKKYLGIIGCGNIGSIVATLALGLKIRVLVYDPYLSPERANALQVERVELDTLLMTSDIITLHVPITPETCGIIDAEALAKTKPGVLIINCARGGLVIEEDLKIAIESGHVAGAALDVFETEPARDNPLFKLDEVIATPHLGASTEEAQENVARQVAEQMSDYLLDGGVINAVNTPSIATEDMAHLAPYMRLAGQLGSFVGQLTDAGLVAATIEYEGAAASLNCQPLTAVILQSLLRPLLDSVNVVNAPVIAKERGIDVREVTREQAEDYQTFIRLTVVTERQTHSIAGTLIAGDKARIVEIKGIKIEAELCPHMIYFTNSDRPGLIGGMGRVLGEAKINIASFHLGRTEVGGDAIGLVSIDSDISDEVLKALSSLPHILQIKMLRF